MYSAGRLFGLIAQGQGHSESEATRHADSAVTSAAPLQPALHSEVGQQQSAAAEGQTAGHADSSQAVTADGEPEGAAEESDIGQQQANAVDRRAARHGAALEGSADADAPEEPALQSGIARQAAATQEGMVGLACGRFLFVCKPWKVLQLGVAMCEACLMLECCFAASYCVAVCSSACLLWVSIVLAFCLA